MLTDLKCAWRMLVKSRGFTAVVIITVALGIGANTAIFSVARAVLFKRLPYPQPERLTVLNEYSKRTADLRFAWPDFVDLREQNHSFEGLAAYRQRHFSFTGGGEAVLIRAGEVSASFFPLLGARPIGRTFSEAEDQPGSALTAVLSYNFWQERFASNRSIIGKSVTLDGNTYTVIGVLPSDFKFFERTTDLYVPVGLEANDPSWMDRSNHLGLRVLGRLRPGVSLNAARGEVVSLMDRIAHDDPASHSGVSINVTSINEARFASTLPVMLLLLGTVGCLMLIACSNIANLQLARAAARQREFAIRTAIGAGRWRLVRQLLMENVLLALVGGALGLAVAEWTIGPLLHLAPSDVDIPRLSETRIDGATLVFTFVLSILTGILFGLAPILQAFKINLNDSLKGTGQLDAGGSGRQRGRAGLLISQVALAAALVIVCGLFARSLLAVQSVNPGFNIDRILAVDLKLPQSNYRTEEQKINFFKQMVLRISSLPGVAAAGAVFCPPLVDAWRSSPYLLENQPVVLGAELPTCLLNVADKGYFEVMQLSLIEGRYLNEGDNNKRSRVIVINKNMAHRLWPNETALGKRIKLGQAESPEPYREIVGVVGDLKQDGLEAPQLPEVFCPIAQAPREAMTLVVRTFTEPMSLAPAVAKQVHAVDPNLPLAKVQPMTQYLFETLGRRRFCTLLLGIFGGLALLLAFVGVYGVMNYLVSRRTNEIGLRMALGAQRRDVGRLIVGQGMSLVCIGLVTGLLVAFAATRLLKALLYGVAPNDPITFAVVVVLLGAVAWLACYLPARAAMSVDPIVALRYE